MIEGNDFRKRWEEIREDAQAALEYVGASGWYVLGEEVRAFEQKLASLWQTAEAVCVGSGLDAIEISLRVLGCGPGDRVLTTPLTLRPGSTYVVSVGFNSYFVVTPAGSKVVAISTAN